MTQDPSTGRAETFMKNGGPGLIVSDFAGAEFASVVARMVRTKELKNTEARALFSKFDDWKLTSAKQMYLEPTDIAAAEAFLRRLDLTLRAPDALHIAMAKRAGASLATFDTKMAASAQNLGLEIAAA